MIRIRLIAPLVLLGLAAGCDAGGASGGGLPPASDWTPPTPAESRPGGGGPPGSMHGGNPHAGMNMGDPHAGMNMGDPHAGMNMGDPHAGMNMGDPHAGMDPMAGMEPPDPDRPIDQSKFLRGTLRATAATEKAIKPGAILFLSAWPIDPTTEELLGAPLAAQKIDVGTLPMSFQLDERDTMVKGTRFEGNVLITARVDGDGEARTKEPGDVEGRLVTKIPAEGLEVVLDTILR
jgi:hypothetical protein